jgi:uncharacterized Zn-finger protein
MADHVVPHFHNDQGVPVIKVGVKEFMCVGANPPFDHPHVYLDMLSEGEKICPYCGTLFQYDSRLHGSETSPPGHAMARASNSAQKAA